VAWLRLRLLLLLLLLGTALLCLSLPLLRLAALGWCLAVLFCLLLF
jgi:hypothetical protein